MDNNIEIRQLNFIDQNDDEKQNEFMKRIESYLNFKELLEETSRDQSYETPKQKNLIFMKYALENLKKKFNSGPRFPK